MSFRFGGIEVFASSGSHSSKIVAAKLGKREGEARRASCIQPEKKKKKENSKGREIASRKFLMQAFECEQIPIRSRSREVNIECRTRNFE